MFIPEVQHIVDFQVSSTAILKKANSIRVILRFSFILQIYCYYVMIKATYFIFIKKNLIHVDKVYCR